MCFPIARRARLVLNRPARGLALHPTIIWLGLPSREAHRRSWLRGNEKNASVAKWACSNRANVLYSRYSSEAYGLRVGCGVVS